MTATRLIASVLASAARLRLTRPASCCAASSARGSASSALKVCCQASTPPASRMGSRTKVRQNRFSASWGRDTGSVHSVRSGLLRSQSSARFVGHEHIADAPDGLDVARLCRISLEQLAQARDLHVQAAVERLELAAARELGQLVAAQAVAGRA